ncbi:MobF family relaxase [Crocosphaera sp. Alani8]|uniref:MobF family relaxase n=1 Tax=Crocosphaera sp. Alani8 TaxID=3038952 RepID=UPI00313D689C
MLTLAAVDADKAKDYFLKDDYDLEENSRWAGMGAQRWGLSGAISNQSAFENLCDGYSPGRRKKLYKRRREKNGKRTAALDCCFNAPKSVTLSGLVGGDDRLINAHRLAVAKVLELIEERYSLAKVTNQKGKAELITTGNLIIAQFDHIDARKIDDYYQGEQPAQTIPDPHLHTHCLIMNATEVNNGDWYSHVNRGIFQNRKLLGMAYQHYLAIAVQEIGYEVTSRDHGQFDIKGYDHDELMLFSKRRRKILELTGNDPSRSRKEAVRQVTRAYKGKINPLELKEQWIAFAKRLEIQIVKPSKVATVKTEKRPSFEKAIADCADKNVSFRREDIEKAVLNQGIPTDIRVISQDIASSPELIKVTSVHGVNYTTEPALQRELAMIRLFEEGRGNHSALSDSDSVSSSVENHGLTQEEYDAVVSSLNSNDQFLAWVGNEDSHQSAIAYFSEVAQKNGYSVRRVKTDEAMMWYVKLGINTSTLTELLKSETDYDPHQVWLVEQAHELGASEVYDLMQLATQVQARVIFISDIKQIALRRNGNPLKSLQQAGMMTLALSPLDKQPTPQLQTAIGLIKRGQIEKGLTRLDENGGIDEIPQPDKVQQIVRDYLAIAPDKRHKTLVLVGNEVERTEIIEGVREGLKKEGRLGKTTLVTQLKRKDLTRIQAKYAHNVNLGDLVVPAHSYKKRGLEKGQYYQIRGFDEDRVILEDAQQNQLTVDLNFEKAVLAATEIEIAEGETLVGTKAERTLDSRKGQTFEVMSINENTVTVKKQDGSQQIWPLKEPRFVDYSIVCCPDSIKGNTFEQVLIAADELIENDGFYRAISKAKTRLKLYTSDKSQLSRKAIEFKAKKNSLYDLTDLAQATRTANRQDSQSRQEGNETHTTATINQNAFATPHTTIPSKVSIRNVADDSSIPVHKSYDDTSVDENESSDNLTDEKDIDYWVRRFREIYTELQQQQTPYPPSHVNTQSQSNSISDEDIFNNIEYWKARVLEIREQYRKRHSQPQPIERATIDDPSPYIGDNDQYSSLPTDSANEAELLSFSEAVICPTDTPFDKTPDELAQYKARLRLRYVSLKEHIITQSKGVVSDPDNINFIMANYLFDHTNNPNRVMEVIGHSDKAYDLKKSIDSDEFYAKFTNYINHLFEAVKQFRLEPENSRIKRYNNQKKKDRDNDLELG